MFFFKNKPLENFEHAAIVEYADRADDYAARDLCKWEKPSRTALVLKNICLQTHPQRILELGVGTGRYFPFLTGNIYVGVDISESMLDHARRRESMLYERGFTRVTLVQNEIHTFLTQHSSSILFDLVFSIGCIGYHIPVTTALMQDISNVLSPAGHLFLQTTQQSWRYRLRHLLRHWRNMVRGRQDNYAFFCTTTPHSLYREATTVSLQPLWVREDEAYFFDKPMLHSLFRK